MKQLICRKQNSIKMHSKHLDRKLTLKAIATDLLSKGLHISVTTLSQSPKLGMKILRWCSYRMTLKKKINYPHSFRHFCALPQNVVGLFSQVRSHTPLHSELGFGVKVSVW